MKYGGSDYFRNACKCETWFQKKTVVGNKLKIRGNWKLEELIFLVTMKFSLLWNWAKSACMARCFCCVQWSRNFFPASLLMILLHWFGMKRALEEKKLAREEARNAERLYMQTFHEKSALVEVYSKVFFVTDFVNFRLHPRLGQ